MTWRSGVNIYEETVIGATNGEALGDSPADSRRKARTYAFKLLAMADRTVGELRSKLEGKGFSEDVVNETVAEMASLGYLDDAKLAARFAEKCAEERGIGPHRIRAELSRRGVAGSLIDEVLSHAFEGEKESEVALVVARTWTEQHGASESLCSEERSAARRRLYSFLARRGFSSEAIERALRRVLS
ncbi:MAG: regulatory protein RecX [Betaproteobacteria bacterium]